jgi:hypothetical protein
MLCGEYCELLQRVQLVAGTAGVREACGYLVAPVLCEKRMIGAGVHGLLELRRCTAHISRAAEDNGVRTFQVVPMLIELVNAGELDRRASALGNGVGKMLGVTVTAVIDDGNANPKWGSHDHPHGVAGALERP